eukprot:8718875-Alexandrium_andersonii.AAC.1
MSACASRARASQHDIAVPITRVLPPLEHIVARDRDALAAAPRALQACASHILALQSEGGAACE